MKPLRTPLSTTPKQRGAVLMVMLVIMIMGVSFFLVSALSKVTLQNARDEKSSEILAQAKEVVIGQLLKGGTLPPGWMLHPDVRDIPNNTDPTYPETSPTNNSLTSNYDGEEDYGCLDNTQAAVDPPYTPLLPVSNTNIAKVRCLGRLPWKSLGMSISTPSENDPTGVMPWYAFSRNLRNPNIPVNSELLNSNSYWLKVYDMKGTLLSDRVAFVIIIPGAALPGQSRPPSPNLKNPDQYLDKISLPAGCSPTGTACLTTYSNYDLTEKFITGDEHRWMDDPANPGKQIEDPTYQFNDKLLYVTIDDLMPLIEKRIAREVKTCLDDYALAAGNTNHKYPWAAPVTDPTRTGTYGVRFGRVSYFPNTAINGSIPTANDTALQNKIITVQTALTNYINGTGSLNILNTKGDALKEFARKPPYNQSTTDPARAAGIYADNCPDISCTGTLSTMINTALEAIPGAPDTTMPSNWTGSCTVFTSSYWADWQDLVFYQVADGFQPGPANVGTCVSCLSISGSGNTNNGSGNYRAAVIIAGQKLPGQVRPNYINSQPDDYLETTGGNSHLAANPSQNFTTYKSSNTANYSTVNDLVLCVDGKNYCK